jgi:hypothetical protein
MFHSAVFIVVLRADRSNTLINRRHALKNLGGSGAEPLSALDERQKCLKNIFLSGLPIAKLKHGRYRDDQTSAGRSQ